MRNMLSLICAYFLLDYLKRLPKYRTLIILASLLLCQRYIAMPEDSRFHSLYDELRRRFRSCSTGR
jgi:hypothetical protein